MDKKIFCKRASELKIAELGLDPETLELVKDENPKLILRAVRNGHYWEIVGKKIREKALENNFDVKYFEATGYKRFNKNAMTEGKRAKLYKKLYVKLYERTHKNLIERLEENGFIRESLFRRPFIDKMYDTLRRVCNRENIPEPSKKIIEKIYTKDVLHSDRDLGNERYETLDIEGFEICLKKYLENRILSKMQMEYFMNYYCEGALDVQYSDAERDMMTVIAENIAHGAEKIAEIYHQFGLTT